MALLRSFAKIIRIIGWDVHERPWFPKEMEKRFDQAMGVDTSAFVLKDDLDIEPVRKKHAVRYQPTSAPQFRQVMSALNISMPEFTFIDFGSGKGKVLMLASELGFKNVIGIELSKSLHAIARENIEKYQSRYKDAAKPVCLNMDAAKFTIPPEPAVLYFYNPFNDEVMGLVLSNVEQSLRESPRQLFVVYNTPVEQDIFDKSLIFRQVGSNFNGRWLTYEFTPARTPTIDAKPVGRSSALR
jgi:SAM-dependent methyltransferase